MKQIATFAVLAVALSGCYQTENGLVFVSPVYEEKNIEVSQVDLEILRKAYALLKDEAVWRKDAVRVCAESATLNLYCALERASTEVTGKYEHRRAALQEVRFVIDDNYKHRWSVHRLADFNAHPETTFEDVKLVIAAAIENVNRKLRITTATFGLTNVPADYFSGQYLLVGKGLESDNTYTGSVIFFQEGGALMFRREVGSRVVAGTAGLEPALGGDTTVLRLRYKENGTNYEQTCLWQSDLDNYPRISCYLYHPGTQTQNPGLEVLFHDHSVK